VVGAKAEKHRYRALPLQTPALKIDAENVGKVERKYEVLAMSITERTAD